MSDKFRCEAKGTHGDVYLYGTIGGDYFGGTSADDIISQIKEIGSIETMTIHVNSPGGSVFDGMAIRSTLAKNKAAKSVEVDGLAGSAATLAISLPDTQIEMAQGSRYMIHNPWSVTIGEEAAHEKTAAVLRGVRDDMLAIYSDRTGLEQEEIGAMMDAETWLSASDAVENGFADSVSEGMAVAACLGSEQFQAQFKAIPEELRTKTVLDKPLRPVDCTVVQSGTPNLTASRIKVAQATTRG